MLRARRLSCISQLTTAQAKRRSEGPNGGCLDSYESAWATAADARLVSAVTRALGAPAGAALSEGLSGPGSVTPPAWWLAVVVLAAVTAVAVLTFIPSRLAGCTGPAPVLQTGG